MYSIYFTNILKTKRETLEFYTFVKYPFYIWNHLLIFQIIKISFNNSLRSYLLRQYSHTEKRSSIVIREYQAEKK